MYTIFGHVGCFLNDTSIGFQVTEDTGWENCAEAEETSKRSQITESALSKS